METIIDNVSYFKWPIGNTVPSKTMSLHAVSKIVMLGELEVATNNVRSGKWSKTEKLPYITPSGCFTKRKASEIISYSGIVSIDLDDVCTDAIDRVSPDLCNSSKIRENLYNLDSCNSFEIRELKISEAKSVSSLKHMLFADKFLNPAFIFVSPSKKGLKIFIRIRNSEASFHDDYFRVLSAYFKYQYGIAVDSACRDISRACFLCHDSEALFSLFGCVSHTDLLRKLPPEPPEPPAVISLLHSLYSRFYHGNDYTRYRSGKLNQCPAVHELALKCLLKYGWVQNGIYFCRPGKTNSRAVSATFEFLKKPGIYSFYPFSSNAEPFEAGKWYTDCMVIALLYFKGDYDRCISALYNKYDSLVRA